MLNRIKNKIDKNLKNFINNNLKDYSLSTISPLLAKGIKDFVLREGKRVRPILFVIGYLGFAKRIAKNLYDSALSIELLHDFMLVHDDIIDKSDTRRGKPSMHRLLGNHLKPYTNVKFNGQDLSIVAGDVMYAMGTKAFLSIKEEPKRKEKALRKFIDAAVFTGAGEFIELINGTKPIEKITKQDINKIYDYKTANYTFATPLILGAILAGADDSEVNKLFRFGLYLGRAFQIKDDILGMFSSEKKIGKSTLSDLQEAKKTLLIWYAYKNSKKDRKTIKRILSKKSVNKADLIKMRNITKESGSFEYSRKEIEELRQKSQKIISSSKIKPAYKETLQNYCNSVLSI